MSYPTRHITDVPPSPRDFMAAQGTVTEFMRHATDTVSFLNGRSHHLLTDQDAATAGDLFRRFIRLHDGMNRTMRLLAEGERFARIEADEREQRKAWAKARDAAPLPEPAPLEPRLRELEMRLWALGDAFNQLVSQAASALANSPNGPALVQDVRARQTEADNAFRKVANTMTIGVPRSLSYSAFPPATPEG